VRAIELYYDSQVSCALGLLAAAVAVWIGKCYLLAGWGGSIVVGVFVWAMVFMPLHESSIGVFMGLPNTKCPRCGRKFMRKFEVGARFSAIRESWCPGCCQRLI